MSARTYSGLHSTSKQRRRARGARTVSNRCLLPAPNLTRRVVFTLLERRVSDNFLDNKGVTEMRLQACRRSTHFLRWMGGFHSIILCSFSLLRQRLGDLTSLLSNTPIISRVTDRNRTDTFSERTPLSSRDPGVGDDDT